MATFLRSSLKSAIARGEIHSLDSVLRFGVGDTAYGSYCSALAFHYHFLRFNRRCDWQTLRWLRSFLFDADVLTLCRHPLWRIDRTAEESTALLGMVPYKLDTILLDNYSEQMRGMSDEGQRQLEIGPGNCISQYQHTAPGITYTGLANELLFSVEGTLRNCIRPEIRFGTSHEIDAVLSELSAHAYSMANAGTHKWLLAADEDQRTVVEAAFRKLGESCSGPAAMVDLLKVRTFERIVRPVDETAMNVVHKDGLIESAFFLVLIDTLISKLTAANGMRFSYVQLERDLAEMLVQFDLFHGILRDPSIAKRLQSDLEWVLDTCQAMIKRGGGYDRAVCDEKWSVRLAEIVATISGMTSVIENDLVSEEASEGDFACAQFLVYLRNYLCRWQFYCDERENGVGLWHTNEAICRIKCWLARPWAVLDKSDVYYAFKDLTPGTRDACDLVITVLEDVFGGDCEEFIAKLNPALNAVEPQSVLDRMIQLRLIVARLMRCHLRLNVGLEIEKCDHAELIIVCLSSWICGQGEECIRHCEEDPEYIMAFLRKGNWVEGFLSSSASEMLSKRQCGQLREYFQLRDELISKYFVIDDMGFDIRSHLDVYPPERFEFADTTKVSIDPEVLGRFMQIRVGRSSST